MTSLTQAGTIIGAIAAMNALPTHMEDGRKVLDREAVMGVLERFRNEAEEAERAGQKTDG